MLSVVVTEVYNDYILVVEASDINHIKNVFRKVKGDRIRAVDGANEYLCEIEKIDEKEIKLKILEKIEDYIVYPGLGDEAGFVGSIALGKIALENNGK